MLSNKIALITGAGSGIGLAVAKIFSNEGAIVCMLDLDNEILKNAVNELKVEEKQSHSYYQCDVSIKEQVDNVLDEIINRYNKIPTIVVNCAGILIQKQFLDTTEADFDRLVNVNFKGTFLVSQLAAKKLVENFKNCNLLREETYASIINIASFTAKTPMDYVSIYGSTKAAVDNLSRSIAKELGKYKIRCNSILPGAIKTPMIMKGRNEEENGSRLVSLGRFGEPSEVAQLCLFLASDMSSYITGASIECSGGMHA